MLIVERRFDMDISHITRSERNWLRALASKLEHAQPGDIIVVFSDDACELATNAAKRMGQWPSVRIMTEETYAKLGED
jgi:hypothetical protein